MHKKQKHSGQRYLGPRSGTFKDATGRQIEKNMNGKNKQVQVQISQEKLKKILKMVLIWKVPGPDGVQEFWQKNFTSLQ